MSAAAAAAAAANAVATGLSESIPNPVIFHEGADFGIWKQRVVAIVISKKWRNSFNAPPLGPPPPGPPAAADVAETNHRAENRNRFYAFLLSSIDDKVAANFRDAVMAADGEALFNTMCQHYESSSNSNKIAVWHAFQTHRHAISLHSGSCQA